jgi:hypothetical protein
MPSIGGRRVIANKRRRRKRTTVRLSREHARPVDQLIIACAKGRPRAGSIQIESILLCRSLSSMILSAKRFPLCRIMV